MTAENRELPETQDRHGLQGVAPKQPNILNTEWIKRNAKRCEEASSRH